MRVALFMTMAMLAINTLARDVYQQPRAFLRETFGGNIPEPKVLWITQPIQERVRKILGHKLDALRVRYWSSDDKTAWVLEQIGKEKPITAGFVVSQGRIERTRVLIFRESRGWEIRYPFFTDQFRDARLEQNLTLDRPIDGISGATLSVRAMRNMARLALYLDRHVEQSNEP